MTRPSPATNRNGTATEIDQDREQRGVDAFDQRAKQRQRRAGRLHRDNACARPRRRSRRRRSEPTKAVTAGIRNSAPVMMPSVAAIDSTQARICQSGVRAGRWPRPRLAPLVAIQENTRLQPDADQHDQDQAEPDRLEQHPPERRREHLGQRLDGGVKHRILRNRAEVCRLTRWSKSVGDKCVSAPARSRVRRRTSARPKRLGRRKPRPPPAHGCAAGAPRPCGGSRSRARWSA